MKKAEPDFSSPVTIRTLFTHSESHPIVLDFAMLKAFGSDWLSWSPETIWSEIHRVFQTQISEHTRAKIQTIKAIHLAVTPWTAWQVFEKIIHGLNGNIPRWNVLQMPTIEELYAGIDILDQLRQETFSDEVKLYTAAVMIHEETCFAPPPLDFIQDELTQPYYECKDCGNKDSALFHDGVCDTCTKKMDPEHNLSQRADPELLAKGYGKNLVLHLTHDPTEVAKRWEEVKDKPESALHLQETAVDVQVQRLLHARDYMNIRRKQLVEQLTTMRTWLGVA